MKFKKTLLLISVLTLSSCSDNKNEVKLNMLDCDGTFCEFDASSSIIKSHISEIHQYDWDFHDGSDEQVTDVPKIAHDFNISLGKTQDGDGPDLDLREVTLGEELSSHNILKKDFSFRTHYHDPNAYFLSKKENILGAEGSSQTYTLDASSSDAGQGYIKKYIWQIDGQNYETESPVLNHKFGKKSNGNVNLIVVNSLGVKSIFSGNVYTLDKESQILGISLGKNIDKLHYSASAELDSYDSEQYSFIWSLNGNKIEGASSKDLNDFLAKEGSNTVEVSLIDNDSGRYVSTVTKSFDTNVDLSAEIKSLLPEPRKYSDGLHYEFPFVVDNMDYSKNKLSWTINGKNLGKKATNVLVNEGSNSVTLAILDKDNNEVDKKTIDFDAHSLPTRVALILVEMGSDNLHYNFSALCDSFNPDVTYQEWVLNDQIIKDLSNVQVNDGLNKITLLLKDKETNKVLAQKSKTWNAKETVGIKAINANELKAADGFHYAFSADIYNYDANKQYLVWKYADGREIKDPNNVKLVKGLNKVYLYVYDKQTQAIVTGSNTKVTVSTTQPKIEDISIQVNKDLREDALMYSFKSVIENNDQSKYHEEWFLNGVKVENVEDIIVKDGRNTVEVRLINNYTKEISDQYKTEFTARKGNITNIIDLQTVFVTPNSDGLHYNIKVETENFDSTKNKLIIKLNDNEIKESNNILFKEGQNKIEAIILKDGKEISSKTKYTTAEAYKTPEYLYNKGQYTIETFIDKAQDIGESENTVEINNKSASIILEDAVDITPKGKINKPIDDYSNYSAKFIFNKNTALNHKNDFGTHKYELTLKSEVGISQKAYYSCNIDKKDFKPGHFIVYPKCSEISWGKI